MQRITLRASMLAMLSFCFVALQSCGDDDSDEGGSGGQQALDPKISLTESSIDFGEIEVGGESEVETFAVIGSDLSSDLELTVSDDYMLSLDNENFSQSLVIDADDANGTHDIYVKVVPEEENEESSSIEVSSTGATSRYVQVYKSAVRPSYAMTTFDHERIAWGDGYNQGETGTFPFPEDLSGYSEILMYVKLDCPIGGCDEWDVFAHIQVQDPETSEWFEMGRYITPYWNDNSQLEDGFEFDVTDFKSLLTGDVNLRTYAEVWNSDGYEVTVNFKFIEGTPDYQYYNIAEVVAYDSWSLGGVPYGSDASEFDLTKNISIPSNAESTHLRTVISGWGHATPVDAGTGRPCAEWCYRTHDVMINGAATFEHYMGPLGCAENVVSNQSPGNWQPDRAGWCPGMVVPIRLNELSSPMAGQSFDFEYSFEPWTSDGGVIAEGYSPGAYYAISTFVVVKSNTEISRPVIAD
ncbi:Peptide-N-glycosidase F, N terminal [Pustulibacterium marinum]|uniref:Peptide-N-glycosidase F, N terminal n=1 Tax=Pustulibacterium marinum TaxID=1224947 RepID=A0A1I7HBQ9_9FLAO|nr:peptide-N-glycosidase F-related protein [Pustulibacterium marinum]SFU58150.1 Peptide-N-glycosidase F, N terminal [Pustulibacterium marinum]